MTKDLSYGMVQPQDIVSEAAVLASCLTDADIFHESGQDITAIKIFTKIQHDDHFQLPWSGCT
jgi:hypothetical protein